MIGQVLLHCFSKTKDCSIVMPENCVSKLNFRTELGLYVGSSHPKTMSEMTKPPLERDILVDPGKKLYFAVKEKV